MQRSSGSLTTVLRAFEIVDALERLEGATPNEMADHLDIPTSTAHDYLRSLAETNYVRPEDGTYRLSYRFLTTGNGIKHRERLYHVARPVLKRLSEETGELSNVTVETSGKAMIYDIVEGSTEWKNLYPGIDAPLYTHATGKAILAHLPADRVDAIIDEQGLERITKHTITDEDVLLSELEQIREEGVAVDWDEEVIGMAEVAAPLLVDDEKGHEVRGSTVELLGSVGLICSTGRIKEPDAESTFASHVREAADAITINYQYGGQSPPHSRFG